MSVKSRGKELLIKKLDRPGLLFITLNVKNVSSLIVNVENWSHFRSCLISIKSESTDIRIQIYTCSVCVCVNVSNAIFKVFADFEGTRFQIEKDSCLWWFQYQYATLL